MKILVLPGDGIGPEIATATRMVLQAVDQLYSLGLSFEEADIGFAALEKHGTTLPDDVLDKARVSDGAILGPISHWDYPPPDEGGRNVSAAFRIELDLFANIRPARARPDIANSAKPMDLVIVREGTEGMYADRNMFIGPGEFMPTADVALSLRKVTAHASRRICNEAFKLATQRSNKLAIVHKANVLHLTDGLFVKTVHEVAQCFPSVSVEEYLVDAMAALLVRDPSRFDVIVTTNLYGDVLSDLASELAGGLGLAGSINAGMEMAVAQAQHGSAPDIANQNIANPSSLILSAAMLLDWLGVKHERSDLVDASRTIVSTIDKFLLKPENRTNDLGGLMGTQAYAGGICQALKALA